jgi:hypothetical protein
MPRRVEGAGEPEVEIMRHALLSLLAASLTLACTAAPEEAEGQDLGGQEAWKYSNDPARFGLDFVYEYAKLPRSGRADKISWAETYWPKREDSMNARWLGRGTYSPLEKYDLAFNDWKPPANFSTLRPLTTQSCAAFTWDPDYYAALGPAAKYWSDYHGNGIARRQASGRDACKSLAAIPDWEGSCHAWAAAAVLEEEPEQAVVVNGVKFEVSDIKALLIMMYDRQQAVVLGDRCLLANPPRDARGRITDDWCRDTNAGAFHVVTANMLGRMRRAFTEDRVMTDEVWNQPVIGYKVKTAKMISRTAALKLLKSTKTDSPFDPRTKKFVEVQMDLEWITESHASTVPTMATIDKQIRIDPYHYVLEIDAEGKIIGGEWTEGSKIPDYLLLPIAPGRQTSMNYSRLKVWQLLEKSRPSSKWGEVFASFEERLIRDWSTVLTSITIPTDKAVKEIEVAVEIAHSEMNDLRIYLEKDGKPFATLMDRKGSGEDFVRKFVLDTSALPTVKGTWTLRVQDNISYNTGKLQGWAITLPKN